MAELGLALSILSVIQLAANVMNMAVTYCGDFKDGPRQRIELLDQLSALAAVLKTLHKHAERGSSGLESVIGGGGPLSSCTKVLEDLRVFLEKNGRGGFRISVKWPSKVGEVSRYNWRIKESIRTLTLALRVEQTWVIMIQ